MKINLYLITGWIFLFLFHTTAYSTAQEVVSAEVASVDVFPLWFKGDKKQYLFKSLSEVEGTGDPVKNEEFHIEIEVIQVTKKGYTLKWTQKMVKVGGKVFESGPENSLTIIYSTDFLGNFFRVKNEKEIYKKIERVISASSGSPGKKSQVMMKDVHMKGLIEGLLLTNIRSYHLFYGNSFDLEETYKNKIEVPGIFSATPLDAAIETTLIEMNSQTGEYTVQYKQEVDKYQFAEEVVGIMAKMLNVSGNEESTKELNEMEISEMKNEVTIESRFDRYGWVTELYQVTTIASEIYTGVKTKSLTLLEK